MDGRFPFDSPNQHGQNPLHNAQVRAALGLSQVDEALYLQRQQDLQRQQELQRDYQLHQMLLQEQMDQRTQLDTILHEHQLKAIGEHLQEYPDLQQHYHSLLINEQLQRQEEETILREQRAQIRQEELRRRQLDQVLTQPHGQHGLASEHHLAQQSREAAAARLREIAADSLAGNAVKRSELEKRAFAKSDDEEDDSEDEGMKPKAKTEDEAAAAIMQRNLEEEIERERLIAIEMERQAELAMRQAMGLKPMGMDMEVDTEPPTKPSSAQALLDFATFADGPEVTYESDGSMQQYMRSMRPKTLGTVVDLLHAADAEEKTDNAASTLLRMQKVEWSDSDGDDEEFERDYRIAVKKEGETVNLPGFVSALPQLPVEPELMEISTTKSNDATHVDDGPQHPHYRKIEQKQIDDSDDPDEAAQEYPYPVDTWWPPVSTIRKEFKAFGEHRDDNNVKTESSESVLNDSPFRANVTSIKQQLANDIEPGVLEKIPHCKIHRQLMKTRKNPSAPELVFCFQVTEMYPNDVMVCCSICGTWRHAACGGHHEPYSIRKNTEEPFNAVCDRCFHEEKFLRDFPLGRKRIDRQRFEQTRRALVTSAVMRQASFSKHSGTYKWPLGSVSEANINGHIRSVHTRHDKAERQWGDMSSRLAKGPGNKPKDKTKVRTKELERLLTSIEDAEGYTDRHNMILFLMRDTQRCHPVGFESRRRNLFDPAEDTMLLQDVNPSQLVSVDSMTDDEAESMHIDPVSPGADGGKISGNKPPSPRKPSAVASDHCAREGCLRKPRFDSLFCSDPCGLSALESDLLRTLHYASDIHPSFFRG